MSRLPIQHVHRPPPPPPLSRLVYWLMSLSRLSSSISIVMFFFANYWLFRASPECAATPVYRYALALLILEYLWVLLPVLLLLVFFLCVCCCLPLVVRLLVVSGFIRVLPRGTLPLQVRALVD